MHETNPAQPLYLLMKEYLSNKIGAGDFSTKFYSYGVNELYGVDLTEKEELAFADLSFVSDRFTDSKEDLADYPKTYFNEVQLRAKVLETVEALKDANPLT